MKEKMNTQNVALAGEFFVLAQLALRDYVGTLTLGHTKHVDVLVNNPRTGKTFRLEVKTASKGPFKSKVFGENYEWIMDKKHEELIDENLFYCFVFLRSPEEMPRFFIISSKEVAECCREVHQTWLNAPRKEEARNKILKVEEEGKVTMRSFLIGIDKNSYGLPIEKYENNWGVFDE